MMPEWASMQVPLCHHQIPVLNGLADGRRWLLYGEGRTDA